MYRGIHGFHVHVYRFTWFKSVPRGAQIHTATGPPRLRVGSGWGRGGAPDRARPTLVTDPVGDGDDRRAALAFRRASNCLAAPAPTGRAGFQVEEAGLPPHWLGHRVVSQCAEKRLAYTHRYVHDHTHKQTHATQHKCQTFITR